MKRFAFILSCCLLCFFVVSEAHADTVDIYLKLLESAKKIDADKDISPPVVLTKEEADEIIQYIMDKERKRGVTLTREQAAIIVGQLAGYYAFSQQMEERLQDTLGANPAKEKAEVVTLPEPDLLPSGLPIFDVDDIYKAYVSNEFATKKTLSKMPVVCVGGDIDTIASEEYYSNPSDYMSGKGEYPCITMGDFEAYLTKKPADLSTVTPGQTVFLICNNFLKGQLATVQAECRIATSGTLDKDKNFQPVYVNDELYRMLFQAKQ